MLNRTTVCIALMASLAACKAKDKKTDKTDTASAPTSGSTDTKPAPAANAVDAEIVAAATKVGAGCKLVDNSYYDMSCPDRKAYDDLLQKKTSSLMSTDPKFAPTFVQILEDKNIGVKGLAANAMYDKQDWISSDKAMQERVLAVAATLPKDTTSMANKLGRVIGFFKLDKTGLFDKVKAIVDNAEAPEALRVGIVNWLLAGNPDSEPAYALVKEQAEKGSPAIKTAALVGLSPAYNKHADEMCKLWLAAMPSLANEPQSLIAAHLTNGDLQVFNENEAFPYNWAMVHSDDNKCAPADVDAALDFIDKQVAGGKADGLTTWWVPALAGPHKSKNSTDAQKAKAVAITKKYVDTKTYNAYQRGNAIEMLVDADPAAAKELADKYANDADSSLKSATERAKKKLEKKG